MSFTIKKSSITGGRREAESSWIRADTARTEKTDESVRIILANEGLSDAPCFAWKIRRSRKQETARFSAMRRASL